MVCKFLTTYVRSTGIALNLSELGICIVTPLDSSSRFKIISPSSSNFLTHLPSKSFNLSKLDISVISPIPVKLSGGIILSKSTSKILFIVPNHYSAIAGLI